MSTFKPMLASPADMASLRFPIYASPKLDGIRCSIVDGQALTRSLKAIPNHFIRTALSRPQLNGLDGELIVGPATAEDAYRTTTSAVMAHEGVPDFTYWVFDHWQAKGAAYIERFMELENVWSEHCGRNVQLHRYTELADMAALDEYEANCIKEGFEGVMVRDPYSPYKFGRSTAREGYLLKVKRFTDAEAEVIGVVEEMHNGNDAQTNELGRTKRSTAKAGLKGKGTLGALQVRFGDIEFNIGSGFTAADRAALWQNPPIGQLVKFKYFEVGMKDAPRHPVYLGLRAKEDVS